MAGTAAVCFFFCFLTLLSCSTAQSSVNATVQCDIKWNITIETSVTVKWFGTEKNANITIDIKDMNISESSCPAAYIHLTPTFGDQEIVIPGLCHNSEYSVNITFICRGGILQSSTSIWTLPKVPTDVLVNNITENSFIVSWKKPPGPIEKYRVLLNDSEEYESYNTSMTVQNLKPYTNYSIQVSAKNYHHWSEWSEPSLSQTEMGVPGAPKDLYARIVTNSSIILEWKQPDEFNGLFIGYFIHVSDEQEDTRNYSTSTTDYEIVGLSPYTNYTFTVYTLTAQGYGPPSEPLTVRTDVGVPYVPRNIKIFSKTNTSVYLQWEEPYPFVGPISFYKVRWKDVDKINEINTTEEFRNITGLQPYTNYSMEVCAATSAGAGQWSEAEIVETKIGVPSAPTNLEVIFKDDTSVHIQWQEPNPSNGPITAYNIQWSDYEKKYTNHTKKTNFLITGLHAYTDYVVKVQAATSVGDGEWSEEKYVKTEPGVPFPPRNVTVISKTNTSIFLEWKEPTPNTGPISWYIVKWTDTNTANISGTSYNITDLDPYKNYSLQVCATTSAGNGDWSDAMVVETEVGVPNIPDGLEIKAKTNTSIELQWEEPVPSTGPIEWYILKWKNSEKEVERNVSETYHNITGLLPFTTYTIQVKAETCAGVGNWSEPVNTKTDIGVPHAPRDVTLSATNISMEVRWLEPEPSTGEIRFYIIEWSNSNTKQHEITKDRFLNITGLPAYTLHHVRVSANTEAGNGSWSSVKTERTGIGVPFSPQIETLEATNTSVIMQWKEPSPFTGPIELYTVQWENTTGNFTRTSSVSFYNITGLSPYTKYTMKVRAHTKVGAGSWSPVRDIKTKVGIPLTPKNVQVPSPSITNVSIHLKWEEPWPSTGPILNYTVEWTQGKEVGVKTTKDISYNITKLKPYTDYTLKVRASTEAGDGEWAEAGTFKTKKGVPYPPRKLKASSVTNSSITLQWDEPEISTGPIVWYLVEWTKINEPNLSQKQIVKERSYALSNLQAYTNYSMKVCAGTSIGGGNWSDVLIKQTDTGIPEAALVNSLSVESPRTVLVKWETRGPYPGPTKYTLEAWKKPDKCKDLNSDTLEKKLEGQVEEWYKNIQGDVFENLTPYTRYYFRVVLSTSTGDGVTHYIPSRNSTEIRTEASTPGAPWNIKADCSKSSTEAEIRWNPPEHPNGIIELYLVEYAVENTLSEEQVEVTDMCEAQAITLKNLKPEKPYKITVRARVINVSEDGKREYLRKQCILPPGIPLIGESTRLLATGSGSHLITLEWSSDVFSDSMGALIQYAVIVGKSEALVNTTSGKVSEDAPPWANFSAGMTDFYQATPPGWNPFHEGVDPLQCELFFDVKSGKNVSALRCFLGLESRCPENITYCNGPLRPDTEYGVKLRAFTRGGFSETHLLYVRTGSVPGSSTGAIVTAVVVSLFFAGILIASSTYIIRKKGGIRQIQEAVRSRFSEPVPPPALNNEPPIRAMILNPYEYSMTVTTENFAEHVRVMMSDTHLKFSQEFEKLKRESPQLPCTVAEMDENRIKNRWMNIFPFDHSRVKLLPLGDEPGSDFINANYIPGASSLREYIATQGPLVHTVDDFWRMIWEQSVTTVVMLTQCVERGKSKCEQYWPASGDGKYYGDMQVRTVSESMLDSYIIRIFHVQLGSKERKVKQMHFTRWPDFGCPESPDELINFVRAVRDHLPRENPGPILVHCSAGVGRTGTFIAVDKVSQQLQHSDRINIYETVLELRQYRTNMVQTEDQYIYIHLCVKQLIQERQERFKEDIYEEAIYSNLGVQNDTSF